MVISMVLPFIHFQQKSNRKDLQFFRFFQVFWVHAAPCVVVILIGQVINYEENFSGDHLWGESKSGFSLSQAGCLSPKVDNWEENLHFWFWPSSQIVPMLSCCEAWEELGKGDRCEFQSSLDAKSGEANAKSKEVTAMSGFHPDPAKPQTPAAQPKCKLR